MYCFIVLGMSSQPEEFSYMSMKAFKLYNTVSIGNYCEATAKTQN